MNTTDLFDAYPEYLDEFGQVGPLPASDGQRQIPHHTNKTNKARQDKDSKGLTPQRGV